MKKKIYVLLSAFIVLFFMSVSFAFAHPGRTDSYGGHYNRATGEYHYHHGHPAHQHPNGVCPYDDNDRAGESSGSSYSDDSEDVASRIQKYADEMSALEDDPDYQAEQYEKQISELKYNLKVAQNTAAAVRSDLNSEKKKVDSLTEALSRNETIITGLMVACGVLLAVVILLDIVKDRKNDKLAEEIEKLESDIEKVNKEIEEKNLGLLTDRREAQQRIAALQDDIDSMTSKMSVNIHDLVPEIPCDTYFILSDGILLPCDDTPGKYGSYTVFTSEHSGIAHSIESCSGNLYELNYIEAIQSNKRGCVRCFRRNTSQNSIIDWYAKVILAVDFCKKCNIDLDYSEVSS